MKTGCLFLVVASEQPYQLCFFRLRFTTPWH